MAELVDILRGELQGDSGEIYVDDQQVDIASPRRSRELGICYIHCDSVLNKYLTIAENIYITNDSSPPWPCNPLRGDQPKSGGHSRRFGSGYST